MTSDKPESIRAVQHSGWYTVHKGSFDPGHAESVTYSERIGSFADAKLDDSDTQRVEMSRGGLNNGLFKRPRRGHSPSLLAWGPATT
jgi:hypothetical protein